MKNILLITNLYPTDDVQFLNNTAVCHFFAKEWVKLGYNVRVIFNYNLYPRIYYPVLKLFRKQLASKFGISILDKYLDNIYSCVYEGIEVSRIPIYKAKPGGGFSQETIDKQTQLIQNELAKDEFVPDVITGHFIHPSLELLAKLKGIYNVPIALTLHGEISKYSEKDYKLFSVIDYMGFRSYPIRRSYEKFYGLHGHSFMCPSGVPQNFFTPVRQRNYDGKLKIIYVGNLIARKYPAAIASALSLLDNKEFSVEYVGTGVEQKHITEIARKNNLSSQITFAGRVPRENVVSHLDNADIFVMISKQETFGLVYLEAMSRGCIVIASSNEGMDGIIEHGVNGFLCDAGNENMLSEILKHIQSLPEEELRKISEQSRITAEEYTDEKVAMDYLSSILPHTLVSCK